VRAIQTGQVFRVIVIMPVNTEGKWDTDPNRAVDYLISTTLFRGKGSLVQRLVHRYGDSFPVKHYFSVYALRTHAVMNGTGEAVSQAIYVHAKVMIVDDRTALIGSANINDRSLLGDRDTELSVVCTNEPDRFPDGAFMSTLAGLPYRVSSFAYSLRMALMNEHMGLPADDTTLEDILDANVFEMWQARARKNTQIYSAVFPNLPSDSIDDMVTARSLPPGPVNSYALANVRGHLVLFPGLFLSHDKGYYPEVYKVCNAVTDFQCGLVFA